MKIISKKLELTIVFLLVLLILNLRPAILQIHGEILVIVIVGFIFFLWALGYRHQFDQRKTIYFILTYLFCNYLVIQSILFNTIEYNIIIGVIFIILGSSVVFHINKDTWDNALKAIIYPVIFFSFSYFITYILIIVFDINIFQLIYFKLKVDQSGVSDHYMINFLFPFSPMVGLENAGFGFLRLGRAVGYMREPGIFQILVNISFFGLDFLNPQFKRARLIKILLLLTLIFTFSTAGISIFFVSYLYYTMVAKKQTRLTQIKKYISVFTFTVIGVGFYLFLFTDNKFGLLRKLQYTSGQSRIEDLQDSINIISENALFGIGYMNNLIEGGSIISLVAGIGIVGAIIFLLLIILPNFNLFKNRDPVLVLFIPVFLTAIFSQPLFDKAIFYLVLGLVVSYPININKRHEI